MSEIRMVSIVIPTLNEAGTIGETIRAIRESIEYPYEIIVVDGGSSDGTQEIVKRNNCKLIVEPKRGYGRALKCGIKHAKGDIIVMVDGDGTYEVRDINRLISALINEKAALCLGARRGCLLDHAMDFTNYFGNKLITFLFNLLYRRRLMDTQSGFRAIRHSALDKIEFKEEDMAFATEMLVHFAKRGFRIVEVPTIYKPRKYGKSKLKRVKAGIEILNVLLKGMWS